MMQRQVRVFLGSLILFCVLWGLDGVGRGPDAFWLNQKFRVRDTQQTEPSPVLWAAWPRSSSSAADAQSLGRWLHGALASDARGVLLVGDFVDAYLRDPRPVARPAPEWRTLAETLRQRFKAKPYAPARADEDEHLLFRTLSTVERALQNTEVRPDEVRFPTFPQVDQLWMTSRWAPPDQRLPRFERDAFDARGWLVKEVEAGTGFEALFAQADVKAQRPNETEIPYGARSNRAVGRTGLETPTPERFEGRWVVLGFDGDRTASGARWAEVYAAHFAESLAGRRVVASRAWPWFVLAILAGIAATARATRWVMLLGWGALVSATDLIVFVASDRVLFSLNAWLVGACCWAVFAYFPQRSSLYKS